MKQSLNAIIRFLFITITWLLKNRFKKYVYIEPVFFLNLWLTGLTFVTHLDPNLATFYRDALDPPRLP